MGGMTEKGGSDWDTGKPPRPIITCDTVARGGAGSPNRKRSKGDTTSARASPRWSWRVAYVFNYELKLGNTSNRLAREKADDKKETLIMTSLFFAYKFLYTFTQNKETCCFLTQFSPVSFYFMLK